MANERITDLFISDLLKEAGISFIPNGSSLKEVQAALKTASKKGTGKVGFPEFTAQVGNFLLVIENKADEEKQVLYADSEQTKLDQTIQAVVNYAENGALHYAQHLVANTAFKKIFAFGCTGDAKRHTIRPIFVDENDYILLDKVENFRNFSQENIENYYRQQVLGEAAPEEIELEKILKQAKDLHEYLRNYGQLGDSEKPLVVSAILLALSEKTFHINSLSGDLHKTDGQILHDAIATYMKRVKVTPSTKKEKVLEQFNIIKNRPALNHINAHLGKTPLRFFAEYLNEHIFKIIKASSAEDILGRFYGEFIRFSGGDGQTLGVVLTPKHITELFCELIDIKKEDRLFDPCCGTSGFLIAGMHHMLRKAVNEEDRKQIKQEQIFGMEIREDMFSIATTNMILRGDGKSNLENRDFLKTLPEEFQAKRLTVGFINPPYSQAKNKDTAHLSEIRFIAHLLDSLAPGGRCVAIVPQSTMVGKNSEDKKVKQQILRKHTLQGVITLNTNTFHGVGVNTCIAVFTAHRAHPPGQRVRFINFEDDGYEVKKHIGLVATPRALEKKQALLDWWFDRKDAPSRYLIKTKIEAADEWLHSFYYFNDEPPIEADFDKTISDYLAFEFSMIMQGREYLFTEETMGSVKKKAHPKSIERLQDREWREFKLTEIFKSIKRGKRLKKDDHIKGCMPYISSTAINNGTDGFIGNQVGVRIFKNTLTIANSGSVGCVFYHPYEFVASDHVTKIENDSFNRYTYLFIASVVKRLSEKYSFNREINDTRISAEKILLPVNAAGNPDYDYMAAYAQNLENKKLEKYNTWIEQRLKNLPPPLHTHKTAINNFSWHPFDLDDVFMIQPGKRLTKTEMKPGNMPFIGASEFNNGITSFVSNSNESEDMAVLGVNYNGSVVENFYHPYRAIFSDDVKRLSFKECDGNRYLYLFAKTAILQQKSKYEYGYKFNEQRMRKQKILLPADAENRPDYIFMENWMMQQERQKLEKYQAWLQRRAGQ